jgi:hypothetical protein
MTSSRWDPPLGEREAGEFAAVAVQDVEGDEDRRRGDRSRVRLAQPLEPRAELLVVDRDLAVENQRAGGPLGDRAGDVCEQLRVVDAVAADEPDAVAGLVREDAPAVHLLLIDPDVAVEGLVREAPRPSQGFAPRTASAAARGGPAKYPRDSTLKGSRAAQADLLARAREFDDLAGAKDAHLELGTRCHTDQHVADLLDAVLRHNGDVFN